MANFYGIGVGPGDPDLLTIKAVATLQNLDILIVPAGNKNGDSEALNIVKNHLPQNIQIFHRHFPMTYDQDKKSVIWDTISDEICVLVRNGKNVGFITLGDPMLYSTYGYLIKRLYHQIHVITVPGVSAYASIASGYNHVLVEGDTPLVIYPCVDHFEAIEQTIQSYDSIVLMKVYKSFEKIKEIIIKHNLEPYSLIVSDYGKENEIHYKDIHHVNKDQISYFTTILINKRGISCQSNS